MENRTPSLAAALRDETARAERRLSEHPSPETLVAYHEGRLPGAEGERLRDHLALCTDCAQLLLDLAAFSDPETSTLAASSASSATPASAHGPTDADVDAAWHSLRSRLGDRGKEEAPPTPQSPISSVLRMPAVSPPAPVAPASPVAPVVPLATPRQRQRRSPWVWALAASWLAVVGLGLWVVELRQENSRLMEPAVNVMIADLAAEGEQVRGGERGGVKLTSAGGHVLFDADAAGLPAHPDYEIEILSGPTGRALWTGHQLKRSSDDHFTLYFPSGFLSPGSYRLRLFGTEEGHREQLADYPFEIRAP